MRLDVRKVQSKKLLEKKMNIPIKVKVKATGEIGVIVGEKEVLFTGFDVKLESGEIKRYEFKELEVVE